MKITDLSTPCLLVDRARLAANIERMQKLAAREGCALRPHVKTHKSFALARQQLEAGARGLTVATVGEAEAFVGAGFDDVRLAYPVVGETAHRRLLALLDRATISFCVESAAGLASAAAAYADAPRRPGLLLEVDCGYGRTGLLPDDPAALELARAARHAGFELEGVLTHGGHAYHGPVEGETRRAALERVAAAERDAALELAARLRDAGLVEAPEVSIGSTPTMSAFVNREHRGLRVTELRPGNYVFADGIQRALEAVPADACALTALTTVISQRPALGRAYVDAGKKLLTTDRGYGLDHHGALLALDGTPLAARLAALSEEHGWVEGEAVPQLTPGTRVRLLPNHACVAVNSTSRLWLHEGDQVTGELGIDARR